MPHDGTDIPGGYPPKIDVAGKDSQKNFPTVFSFLNFEWRPDDGGAVASA
jgi:hypothetical protein